MSAQNIAASLSLSTDDRCLNVMPLFHIHGLVAALLASLRAHATVICTPGFAGDSFFGWVDELGPSWYTAVPTIHQEILRRDSAGPRHHCSTPSPFYPLVVSSTGAPR